MKRFSLIIIALVFGCCISAQAQSRGYTSTQTTSTGGGTGSLDSLVNGINAQPKKKATTEDDRVQTKANQKTFVPPKKAPKSKTVKDDRKVVVTKDAIDTDAILVKLPKLDKGVAPSNKAKIPTSPLEKSPLQISTSLISPTQKAPQ